MHKYCLPAAAMIAMAAPACAQAANAPSAQTYKAAIARVDAAVKAVEKIDHAPPGLAIIMVARGQAPAIRTYGVRDLRSQQKVTADTPFYIASMSKAYAGLLAADLDTRHIFDIDQSLMDIWPDLEMPKGLKASKITFRQWLNHRAPLKNSTIGFRASYVGRIATAEIPHLLSAYSSPRPDGFHYTNTGYVVFGAALETKTNRAYRDWLKQIVFDALGMTNTHTRSSAYAKGSVSAGHFWDGKRWHVYDAKPDALMNPPGGIVTTPNDMARWLTANMTEIGGDISHAVFVAAHKPDGPLSKDRDGFACTGYALGWYVCTYNGMDVLSHGGGYVGVRSLQTVSVGHGMGIAVFSNADSGNLEFMTNITKIFLDACAGKPVAQTPKALAMAFKAQFDTRIEKQMAAAEKNRARALWGGWHWHPSQGALKIYAGTYRSDRLGDMAVTTGKGALIADLGLTQFMLTPAKTDLFGAVPTTIDSDNPDEFRFQREKNGAPKKLFWGDREFDRVK